MYTHIYICVCVLFLSLTDIEMKCNPSCTFSFLVPSRPPSKITAKNHTSLAEIPISWEPVPQEFIHGRYVGYRVTYQAVFIGDLPAYFEPVMSIDVGNENTSMILRDLEPVVMYKITVAAISNQGPGPKGVTFGGGWR